MLCSRDARCRCKSSLSALIYRSSISRNSKRARCVRYASQRSMPFVVRLIARLAIFSNFVLTPPNQRSKDAKIGVPNKYRGYLQTMPSVSGEKELKPKTTSFYSTSSRRSI